MRVRKNPQAEHSLIQNPKVFDFFDIKKGDWRSKFTHPYHPIYVELGTGKGQFITTAATLYPQINWIAVERVPEPLYQATKKAEVKDDVNLLYFWIDINQLDQLFQQKEVSRFYLHFSDPWPKQKHQKRRLTHHHFLKKYQQLLKPSGDIILKTDSYSLFTFTITELNKLGWNILAKSHDFHESPFSANNIQTEYEEKFSSRGLPIYYLQFSPC